MMIGYIDFTDDAPLKKTEAASKADRGAGFLEAIRILNKAAERRNK
jgi:hypothetical protein